MFRVSPLLLAAALLTMLLTMPPVLPAQAWTLKETFALGRTMGFVPKTANNMGEALDGQLMRALGPAGYGRDTVSIACTVPVYLGDLEHTSPLARQMSEELTRYFLEAGYGVDELRKGSEVVMRDDKGEFLLTRDLNKLFDRNVTTQLILVGTYTFTDKSVRFNMKLLYAPGKEVVAAASGSVPITDELAPLMADVEPPPAFLAPSVQTRLPRR